MHTETHANGKAVTITYFGDLQEKMSLASGYVRAINRLNDMMAPPGTKVPHLCEETIHKAIVRKHKKFYGLTSKYDGRGNLRAA